MGERNERERGGVKGEGGEGGELGHHFILYIEILLHRPDHSK